METCVIGNLDRWPNLEACDGPECMIFILLKIWHSIFGGAGRIAINAGHSRWLNPSSHKIVQYSPNTIRIHPGKAQNEVRCSGGYYDCSKPVGVCHNKIRQRKTKNEAVETCAKEFPERWWDLEACDSRINHGGRWQGHYLSLWTKLGICSGETPCEAMSGRVKTVLASLYSRWHIESQ